jgi:uncharacterized protein YgbK (DUF1537 family)
LKLNRVMLHTFAKGIVILADDLTGAADTGVHFTSISNKAILIANAPKPDGAWVQYPTLILNTATRGLPEKTAVIKTNKISKAVRQRALIYKKIDSTIRGTITSEIEAIMESTSRKVAVLSPAYPAVGRKMVDGSIFVNDRPMLETEFMLDPNAPEGAHLPSLIESRSSLPVHHISLECVRAGYEVFAKQLLKMDEGFIVVDAEREDDLSFLVKGILLFDQIPIVSGSGGLAKAIAREIGITPPVAGIGRSVGCKRILAVVGSRSETTRRQVQHLLHHRACIHLGVALGRKKDMLYEIEGNKGRFNNSDVIVLSTYDQPYLPGMDENIRRELARMAVEIARRFRPDALILSGGAVAQEVCAWLGIQKLSVDFEIQTGIPFCTVLGEPLTGLKVITKAGAFGASATLSNLVAYLKGG